MFCFCLQSNLTKKSSGRNKSVTFFAIAKTAPLLSAAYFGVSHSRRYDIYQKKELLMLKNLKMELDSRISEKFEFGSTDAWDDDLLESCFCEIESINSFLKGNKEFLVGAKGAGKSAIFRLISEGKRKFYNPNKLKQIVISVNEVMEYTAVRKLVNGKLGLVDNIDENELFYFWEVYILYRILRDLKANHIKIYSSLNRDSHDFMKHFEESKPGFVEFLKGLKGTAGVKFDISNPNLPIPDFYISAEGNKVKEELDKKLPIILIDTIKSDICSKLRRFKSVIYVLVDNLDDFSSREEFDAQKQVIQGLVETCKYYTKFPEVKIKASLRPEL